MVMTTSTVETSTTTTTPVPATSTSSTTTSVVSSTTTAAPSTTTTTELDTSSTATSTSSVAVSSTTVATTAAPATTSATDAATTTTTTTSSSSSSAPAITTTTASPSPPPGPTPAPTPRRNFDMRLVAAAAAASSANDDDVSYLQVRESGAPSSVPWSYAANFGTVYGPLTTARSLCRMAGMPLWRFSLYDERPLPAGDNSVLVSDVACSNTSQTFSECAYQDGVSSSSESAGTVAVVRCMGDPEWDVGIGFNKQMILRRGNTTEWGAACRSSYSGSAFSAAARQAGMPDYSVYYSSKSMSSYYFAYTNVLANSFTCYSGTPAALGYGECTLYPPSSSSSCYSLWTLSSQGASTDESRFRLWSYSASLRNVIQHSIYESRPRDKFRPLCGDGQQVLTGGGGSSIAKTLQVMCSNLTGTAFGNVDGSTVLVMTFPFGGNNSDFGREMGDDISPLTSMYCNSATGDTISKPASMANCYLHADTMGKRQCMHGVAALECSPKPEYSLEAGSGRVWMRPTKQYTWGALGLQGMTRTSARALCRAAGRPSGAARGFVAAKKKNNVPVGPVYASGLNCVSKESDLSSMLTCPISSAPSAAAHHASDAGVLCATSEANFASYNLLLEPGTGTLLVKPASAAVASSPGAVCAPKAQPPSAETARTICGWFGLPTSGAAVSVVSNDSALPIYMTSLSCSAGAANLSQCSFSTAENDLANCASGDGSSSHIVTIVCKEKNDFQFRISSSYKILETRPTPPSSLGPFQPWGTVCGASSSSFTPSAAQWLCRSLSLPWTGATWQDRRSVTTVTPPSDMPIYLQSVTCNLGSSQQHNFSASCNYQQTDVGCSHRDDVVLDCQQKKSYDLSLATCSTSGYCVVYSRPSAGGDLEGVCADGFTDESAKNVCRLMARPTANVYFTTRHLSSSYNNYQIRDLTCADTDTSLASCYYATVSTTSPCNSGGIRLYCEERNEFNFYPSSVDSSITTRGGSRPLVRLQGSTYYSSTNFAICAKNIDIDTVRALCRIMGHSGSGATFKTSVSTSLNIGMRNLKCLFGATSLDQCDYDSTSYSEDNLLCRASSSGSSGYATLWMSCMSAPAYEYRLVNVSVNASAAQQQQQELADDNIYAKTASSASVASPPSVGQLQVRNPLSSLTWTPVCAPLASYAPSLPAAAPLCALLGFPQASSHPDSTGFFEFQQPPAGDSSSSSSSSYVVGTQPGWKIFNVSCPPFAASTAECVSHITFAPCPSSNGAVVGLRCGGTYVGVTPSPQGSTHTNRIVDGTKMAITLSNVNAVVISMDSYISPQTYNTMSWVSSWYNNKQLLCPNWMTADKALSICRLLGYQRVDRTVSKSLSMSSSSGFAGYAFKDVSCRNIAAPGNSSSNSSSSSSSSTVAVPTVFPADCTFDGNVGGCSSTSSSTSTTQLAAVVDCYQYEEYFRDGFFFKYDIDTGIIKARKQGTSVYKHINAVLCVTVGLSAISASYSVQQGTSSSWYTEAKSGGTALDGLRCPGQSGMYDFSKCEYMRDNNTKSAKSVNTDGDHPDGIKLAKLTCKAADSGMGYYMMLAPDGRLLTTSSSTPRLLDMIQSPSKFKTMCTYSTSYLYRTVPLICDKFGITSPSKTVVYSNLYHRSELLPRAFSLYCSSRKKKLEDCSFRTPQRSGSTRYGRSCFSSSSRLDLAVSCSGTWNNPGVKLNLSFVDPSYASRYHFQQPAPPIGLWVGLGIGIFAVLTVVILVVGYRINASNRARARAQQQQDQFGGEMMNSRATALSRRRNNYQNNDDEDTNNIQFQMSL